MNAKIGLKLAVYIVACVSLTSAGCMTSSNTPNGSGIMSTSPLQELWTAGDAFSQPESAYYDAESSTVFVSNMAGGPVDKTGAGFITAMTLGGKVISAKWVTGLNSPKGLRAYQGVLWVTAIDEVVGIRIKDAKIIRRIAIPGALCLNDLEIDPSGTIFVSDIFANKILAVKGGVVTVYAEGAQLESPNGLLWNKGRLVVGGSDLQLNGQVDFDRANKMGHLFYLDAVTKEKHNLSPEPIGMIDAVEADDAGNFLVSDWLRSKIYRISSDGRKEILAAEGNTADFSFVHGKNILLVPFTGTNSVKAFRYQ